MGDTDRGRRQPMAARQYSDDSQRSTERRHERKSADVMERPLRSLRAVQRRGCVRLGGQGPGVRPACVRLAGFWRKEPRRQARCDLLSAVADSVSAIIAVAGTLLGSALTYWFQQKSFDRMEARRFHQRPWAERLRAYNAYTTALAELRRGQADCYDRRLEGPDSNAEMAARVESYRPRGPGAGRTVAGPTGRWRFTAGGRRERGIRHDALLPPCAGFCRLRRQSQQRDGRCRPFHRASVCRCPGCGYRGSGPRG